jgi:hypothetical protein
MNDEKEYRTSEIGRINIAVEIDGAVCFVVLPQDKLRLLMNMAAGLSYSGALTVIKAPDDYKFQPIKEAA